MWILVLSIGINVSCVDAWWFDGWPIKFLDEAADKANGAWDTDKVQDTILDNTITSAGSACSKDSRYTFSNTLCIIKSNLYTYLQYTIYVGLAVATIMLVRNGLRLVVAKDNEAQFKEFKKNMISIGVWVLLLIGFYIIIEVFVSVVNLLTE